MPQTALKNLAKHAGTDINRVEYLWKKAAAITKKEYDVDEKDGKFWALRMGITKKMLGLPEAYTFTDFLKLYE